MRRPLTSVPDKGTRSGGASMARKPRKRAVVEVGEGLLAVQITPQGDDALA